MLIFYYTVPGTPYQVKVVAGNSAGMEETGSSKLFFSQELTPTKAPENVQVKQLSDTSVNVTWVPLTLFEAQGFPQYIVTLSPVSAETESRQKRRTNPTIITSDSFAVFTHLDAEYSVAVSATTGGGSDSVMSSLPVNSTLKCEHVINI